VVARTQSKTSNLQNSRTKGKRSTLATLPRRQAERFLSELANLRGDPASVRRLEAQLGAFAPWPARWSGETGLRDLRDKIRQVWLEPNLLRRQLAALCLFLEVAIELLQDETRTSSGARRPVIRPGEDLLEVLNRIPVPPPDPLSEVFSYFTDSTGRARYCPGPECLTPYFLAKRRTQRYCSDACSKPAQQRFKREWWGQHGKAWRKAREALAKKSQRKRGK
jgi:hypothetical protein